MPTLGKGVLTYLRKSLSARLNTSFYTRKHKVAELQMPTLGRGALTYLLAQNDRAQDAAIGAFRPYLRGLVPQDKPTIEIGPSFSPIIPKRLGFDVRIVDHADRDELVTKYRDQVPDVSVIEDVDVVWQGEPLSTLLPRRQYAAIVASHVIEHAPDFVGFLKECSELLADGGAIYLIVPDRRFCFDAFAPPTDPAKVIADHRLRRTLHSFESFYRVGSQVRANGEIAWDQQPVERLEFLAGTPPDWLRTAEAMADSATYIDNHENFFTPSSFVLLIEELRFIGLLDLGIAMACRTRGCEFVAILSRHAGSAPLDAAAFAALKRSLHFNMLREEAERIALMQPLLAAEPQRS
jgi:SAM-dependent methyltransferase